MEKPRGGRVPVCSKCRDTGLVCDRSGLRNCQGWNWGEDLGKTHLNCWLEPCACPAGDKAIEEVKSIK